MWERRGRGGGWGLLRLWALWEGNMAAFQEPPTPRHIHQQTKTYTFKWACIQTHILCTEKHSHQHKSIYSIYTNLSTQALLPTTANNLLQLHVSPSLFYLSSLWMCGTDTSGSWSPHPVLAEACWEILSLAKEAEVDVQTQLTWCCQPRWWGLLPTRSPSLFPWTPYGHPASPAHPPSSSPTISTTRSQPQYQRSVLAWHSTKGLDGSCFLPAMLQTSPGLSRHLQLSHLNIHFAFCIHTMVSSWAINSDVLNSQFHFPARILWSHEVITSLASASVPFF